jgi:hypothetical protein
MFALFSFLHRDKKRAKCSMFLKFLDIKAGPETLGWLIISDGP